MVKQWDLESSRCIRIFQGNNSEVTCLATVVADRLLFGDLSGSVLLWDIATGEQLASVNAHPRCVGCLAVTADNCFFVSGSWDHSLKLWCFEGMQQPVIQFNGHTEAVNACAVSSDGSRLYSGSSDESVRVWDMSTGQQLASMQSHTRDVTSLALSGSLLISGSLDKTVKLWDTGSMQLLHTLRGHSDPVRSVAVSSGGKHVLSGGGRRFGAKGTCVRVWDPASGAQLAVLQGHSNQINCITASSDGRLAVASQDQPICVWDLAAVSMCARLEDYESYVELVLFA